MVPAVKQVRYRGPLTDALHRCKESLTMIKLTKLMKLILRAFLGNLKYRNSFLIT